MVTSSGVLLTALSSPLQMYSSANYAGESSLLQAHGPERVCVLGSHRKVSSFVKGTALKKLFFLLLDTMGRRRM